MKCIIFLLACITAVAATAQEKLVIMGKAPDLYVEHTITSETSLQTVSNQFGQSVTRLSTYNHLDPGKKLAKGTKVRIPLTQYNLVRSKGDHNSAPLYHIIQKGDNLYRLSKEIKVPLATLKQWNGFTSDAVKIGEPVIVGFMVNARVDNIPSAEQTAAKPETRPEVQAPKVNADLPVITTNAPKTEDKPIIKSEPPAAVKQPVNNSSVVTPPPVTTAPVTSVSQPANTGGYVPRDGDEGFFATAYAQQSKEQTKQFHSGDAATFKTISGWSDRKYYVLINDVAPETIVRITAPNNRSICAKVLGPLQETKGGSGLLLRMSNSAASTLGITDAKFTVTVTYFE